MEYLNDLSFEKFKLWLLNALRIYLSVRMKPITGNLDELVLRALSAWEENLPVDVYAEKQQKHLLTEYKTKLCLNGESIQDLFDVKSGWTGEKASLTKWPSVYILDISEYLNRKNPQGLMKRLLNEYKEGKACRYFSGKWLKEIYYHYISEKSDKCMLKAKVMPSQAVNNIPYDCWIIIKKDVEDIPGGQSGLIMSAFCTCTAGMLGSCNHIAGVLFRNEHAVRMGMTKSTSTGKLCEWTVAARKTKVNHKKISDFVWKKFCYSKMLTDVNQENEID